MIFYMQISLKLKVDLLKHYILLQLYQNYIILCQKMNIMYNVDVKVQYQNVNDNYKCINFIMF